MVDLLLQVRPITTIGMPFLNAVPFNIQAIQDRFHILRCCCCMQSKDVFNLKLGSQWTSFLSASDPASVHLDICAWMFLRTGQSCCSHSFLESGHGFCIVASPWIGTAEVSLRPVPRSMSQGLSAA